MRISIARVVVAAGLILAARPAAAGIGTWTSNGPPGGRVSAIVLAPSSFSTAYAGTRSGVFKTTDSGDTWAAINNGLTSGVVSSLAHHPTDPNTVYAGTRGGVFPPPTAGRPGARSACCRTRL